MKHCLDTCYNVFHSFKVWHWSDSPENQFSPLNTGSGIQNCALMFQSNGMFKQDSCILHYPYVCEVQSGTFGVFFCLKLFYNAKNNCRCNFTFLFYIILIDVSCIVWLYVFFRIFSIELPWQQNARYEKRLYLKNVQQTLKCQLTFKR